MLITGNVVRFNRVQALVQYSKNRTNMKEKLSEEQRNFLEQLQNEVSNLIDAGDESLALEKLEQALEEEEILLRSAIEAQLSEFFLEQDEPILAIKRANNAIAGGWKDAPTYVTLGWAYYNNDDTRRAADAFDTALTLDEKSAEALFGRAMVHQLMDELELAKENLEAAIHYSPNYPPPYAYLAEVELDFDHYEEAKKVLKEGRENCPDDPDLALLDAQFSAAETDFDKALSALNVLESDPPTEATALEIEILTRKNDWNDARKLALQLSNAHSDEAFAFYQLGAIMLLCEKYNAALKAAERSVTLDPTLPDAYALRAIARLLNDDLEGGLEDLENIKNETIELPLFLLGPVAKYGDKSFFLPSFQRLAEEAIKKIEDPEKRIWPTFFGKKPSTLSTSEKNQKEKSNGSQNSENPFQGSNPFAGNPFAGMPKDLPPNLNPAALLGTIFDSEGNVMPMFKPIMKMALANAPSMMKNMPKELLAEQNIDPAMFESANFANMSDEDFDNYMKLLYKTLKERGDL